MSNEDAKEVKASNEPMESKDSGSASEAEHRRELMAELDDLVQRLKALTPEYEPPPFSSQRLTASVEASLRGYPQEIRAGVLKRLRTAIRGGWFDLETLKGVWYMANYTIQYNTDLARRRLTGEYDTDEWGVDWEFLDVVRPFLAFLYKVYWRVETSGIENVPIEGPVLLAANHSGQLPWDGMMVTTAVMTEHPAQRLVRNLYEDWYPSLPFVSAWLVRMGQALATVDNGVRLLEQDEVVAVYPEGYKGVSKTYWERYRLARFGQGDFVKMALATNSPIIPVAVVGAEETYLALGNSRTLAQITGFPYFTISPTFPWLGLLGLVPLPTKWYIDFGEAILLDGYGPGQANNLVLVAQLTDQVRNTVQEMVQNRVGQRGSVWLG